MRKKEKDPRQAVLKMLWSLIEASAERETDAWFGGVHMSRPSKGEWLVTEEMEGILKCYQVLESVSADEIEALRDEVTSYGEEYLQEIFQFHTKNQI